MTGLLVIVPTRGRPDNAERLTRAFHATSTGHADLLFAVDDDDPALRGYLSLPDTVDFRVGERLRMCPTLNVAAVENAWSRDYLGFMGDDHLPVTVGWDEKVRSALDTLGTGIVYGNDLIHGPALPTAVFMTADIVRALGWMCPPGLVHLYADNAWKALGEALGALTYLPDVIIEHLHPIAGKSAWDDGYRECNDGGVAEHDRAVFETWRATRLADDVARIKSLTCVS